MKRGTFRKPTIEEVREKQARKMAQAREKMQKATKLGKSLKNVGKVAKQAKKPPKKTTKTQAQLKKELDRVFSIYIRKIHPPVCYTCGKTDTPLQCGHFVPRQYLATRWHKDNTRPQCIGCNIYGNGKILDFEEHLKRDLGEEYVEGMKATRHQTLKLDRLWYEEKIAYYKNLI